MHSSVVSAFREHLRVTCFLVTAFGSENRYATGEMMPFPASSSILLIHRSPQIFHDLRSCQSSFLYLATCCIIENIAPSLANMVARDHFRGAMMVEPVNFYLDKARCEVTMWRSVQVDSSQWNPSSITVVFARKSESPADGLKAQLS